MPMTSQTPDLLRQDSEDARLSPAPHHIVLFDFVAEDGNSEISVAKGDLVFVDPSHMQDAHVHDDGWVWVRKRPSAAIPTEQTQGYVPYNSLKRVPYTKGEDDKPDTHEVLHDFTAESGEEMTVKQGDHIHVIGELETDNGWVFVKKVPELVEGYVPKSFLSAASPVAAKGSAGRGTAGAVTSPSAAREVDISAGNRQSPRDSFAHVRTSQQHGVCSNCCGKGCGVFLDSIAVEDNGIDTQRAVCCKLVSLFLQLFIICSPAAFAPIVLFSRIGWGTSVFTALADTGSGWWWLLFGGGLAILVLLYVLDFSYWEGNWLCMKRLLVAVAAVALAGGAVFSAASYPAAPFCVFIYFVPVYVSFVRRGLYHSVPVPLFLRAFAFAYVLLGILVGICWAFWVAGAAGSLRADFGESHWWSDDLRDKYALDACPNKVSKNCLAAFILWGAPFVGAVTAVLFGLVAWFLSQTLAAAALRSGSDEDHQHAAAQSLSAASRRRLVRKQERLQAIINMTAGTVVLLLFCLWVAASISGADMGIANVVSAFGAAGIITLSVVVGSTVGWKNVKQSASSIPLVRKILSLFSSDWTKACFLLGVWPVILVYVSLSFLNQIVRKVTPCSKTLTEHDHDINLWITKRAHEQLRVVSTWHITSVFVKIAYVGIAVVVLLVGVGKAVVIGLAWLNVTLEGTPYGTVIAIFWAVGLIMFLLPPVPGVPVYLAGGVILVHSGTNTAGHDFVSACVYAILVCFGIKLSAIFMQQQGIGARLKDRVWVRSLVGVNSLTIRAIKYILQQPGVPFLDIRKVSILCGGPDWPVSVLTGILGLNPISMLLGSVPVILVIAATCLAGAFELKKSEGPQWESIAKVAMASMVVAQTGALVLAMYFVEGVAAHKANELRAFADDHEVLELEKRKARQSRVYRERTQWSRVPCLMRLVLVLGMACVTLSMYAVQFAGGVCFRVFAVNGKIDLPYSQGGLAGNATNIVKPLGKFALYLFAFGLVLTTIFVKWAGRFSGKASDADAGASVHGFSDAATALEDHDNRQSGGSTPISRADLTDALEDVNAIRGPGMASPAVNRAPKAPTVAISR